LIYLSTLKHLQAIRSISLSILEVYADTAYYLREGIEVDHEAKPKGYASNFPVVGQQPGATARDRLVCDSEGSNLSTILAAVVVPGSFPRTAETPAKIPLCSNLGIGESNRQSWPTPSGQLAHPPDDYP
jgi:hypothetical protein